MDAVDGVLVLVEDHDRGVERVAGNLRLAQVRALPVLEGHKLVAAAAEGCGHAAQRPLVFHEMALVFPRGRDHARGLAAIGAAVAAAATALFDGVKRFLLAVHNVELVVCLAAA